MSSARSHVSEEHRTATNRLAQQYAFHLRAKSHSAPVPYTPSSATNRPNLQSRSSSNTLHPSPLKMVTTTSSSSRHHSHKDASSYYVSTETHTQEYGWMVPTVIEDDDLMFGGKSLSAWHEEGRQVISSPEEEKRGRQRVSPRLDASHVGMPLLTCLVGTAASLAFAGEFENSDRLRTEKTLSNKLMSSARNLADLFFRDTHCPAFRMDIP